MVGNVVLYHRADNDGFGCFVAAFTKFYDKAEYYAVDYGDDFAADIWEPRFQDRSVFMCDFTGPPEFMMLAEKASSHLVIIDHHEAAYNQYKHIPDKYIFSNENSAAVLCWQYFHGTAVPLLLYYVEDRDLWNWCMADSEEINTGLDVIGHDYAAWKTYLHDVAPLKLKGEAALQYERQRVENICSFAWTQQFGPFCGVIVNSTIAWSKVCHALLEKYPEADFAITWYEQADGQRKYSFRSRPGFNVQKIAKKLGGGGHAQASGMTYIDSTSILFHDDLNVLEAVITSFAWHELCEDSRQMVAAD